MKRPKNNTADFNVNSKVVISKREWGAALGEARMQLVEMKLRVARLKAAIRVFAEKQKEAGTDKKSIPA